jgi:RNA polymerase sigma-70 factor (ECF subfamily)
MRTGLSSTEQARFETAVLPHLDAGYTLARHLMRTDHDAEDVVQDACLRALRHIDGFRADGDSDSSARAWFLTIVRNTAYSWQRRHRPDSLATEFDETQHSPALSDAESADIRQHSAKETVSQALGRMAPEYREVIVLRELEGLSYKEISQVAGVPVGTVMSRLSRARARLQEVLRRDEED